MADYPNPNGDGKIPNSLLVVNLAPSDPLEATRTPDEVRDHMKATRTQSKTKAIKAAEAANEKMLKDAETTTPTKKAAKKK
jgi:hypothetical protein